MKRTREQEEYRGLRIGLALMLASGVVAVVVLYGLGWLVVQRFF